MVSSSSGNTKYTLLLLTLYVVPFFLSCFPKPHLIVQLTYMLNAQRITFGFHGHSLLLSLPPALLVWAILSFSITLILHAIDGDKTSRISTWPILGVFAVLATAVIWTLYVFSTIWKSRKRSVSLGDRVAEMWRGKNSFNY